MQSLHASNAPDPSRTLRNSSALPPPPKASLQGRRQTALIKGASCPSDCAFSNLITSHVELNHSRSTKNMLPKIQPGIQHGRTILLILCGGPSKFGDGNLWHLVWTQTGITITISRYQPVLTDLSLSNICIPQKHTNITTTYYNHHFIT